MRPKDIVPSARGMDLDLHGLQQLRRKSDSDLWCKYCGRCSDNLNIQNGSFSSKKEKVFKIRKHSSLDGSKDSHHGSVDSFLGTLTETPCKGVDTLTKSLDSSKDSIKKIKNPFKRTSLGSLNSSDRNSKKKTTKTHKRAFSDTVAERNHDDFTNNLYTNDQIMKTKDNILTEGVTTRPNSACICRNGVILIDEVESQQEGLSNVKLSDEKLAQELSHEQKRKMQLKKTLSLDGNLMLLKRGMKLLWKLPKVVLVPNRNPIEDLYKLFPQLPPGEKPLNDFSCALYKDILLQGKMIICSSCICFHSNIFGYETRVIIHFKNVVAIKRERTAFVVPNAISVRTVKKRYLFCSFLSRETSFKLLSRIWKQAVHMEPDENDNSPTDPIKIRPGGAKEASDDLLNFSSSSSFGSSFPRPTALPDRPHSSPPSLGGLGVSNNDGMFCSPRSDLEDCVFTVADMGGDSDCSTESCDSILDRINESTLNNTTNCSHIRRVKSTSNLSEVAALGHKFCFKNLERIRNDYNSKRHRYHEQHNGPIMASKTKNNETCKNPKEILCTISSKFKEYGNILSTRLWHLTSFVNSLRTHHPFLLLISILVLLLSIFTFNLLLRINFISDSIQVKNENQKVTDNLRLKNLFEFKEGIHSANVERMRSILSVNLETVSEVQKTLRELRDKLKSNDD